MAQITEIVQLASLRFQASPVTYTIGIAVLVVALEALRTYYFHPLSKIPGPRLAKISELWRSGRYFKGNWHLHILQLHRQYGPVVRVAPNEVSIVSPDLTKTIYSYSKGTSKTDWYDTWKALGGKKSAKNTAVSFFGATDPKQHGFLRKRVSGTYTMSSVVSMEPKIQPVLDSLWQRFDGFAKSGQSINLSMWASYFTYDVVGTLCLSEPMGFIRDGEDKRDFIFCIHGAFYWISNLGYLPWQSGWIANSVTGFLAPLLGLRVADYAKAFQRLAVNKVIERMKQGPKSSGQRDMLDHFMSMKGPNGEPVPISEIMAEVGNLLAAGADTTSVAIKAVLGPLLKDPARYQRLRAEIDDAMKAFSASETDMKVFTYNDIKDLPFLSACVKEGSRVHPSIIYQLPRKAPLEGINIEGYYISSSATVSMSPLAQNRCQAIFGEDADEWRPERWIEGEGNTIERIKDMDKNLATFGYGSRTCVGRNLATFEVYKFVAQLLSRYDVELKEYTFKREANVSIEADVYFSTESGATKAPIALYFHGGNFTVGSKALLPRYHRDRLLELGFVVVSANYRLCPTINVYDGPVKDSLDAYEWVRLTLPGLLKEEGVDADSTRIVVLGHSCGATLALLTASLPSPPKAIVDLFGMKYLQDPLYHTASPTKGPVFEQEFIDQIHKDTPPPTSGPPPMGPNGPDFSNYRVAWMFSNIKAGTHMKTVVADGDFIRVDPAFLFSKKDFPPTFFVHGTADTLVDARFSQQAHKELKANGVESELVLVEGAGHGLDAKVAPGDEISAIVDRALQFLKAHV
ncbi:hypothetical protein FDECE_3333 [Fusarium decemcellulare]|nr:hypothetical protein FDECE_3333 [Fusarium decemcellulare]